MPYITATDYQALMSDDDLISYPEIISRNVEKHMAELKKAAEIANKTKEQIMEMENYSNKDLIRANKNERQRMFAIPPAFNQRWINVASDVWGGEFDFEP